MDEVASSAVKNKALRNFKHQLLKKIAKASSELANYEEENYGKASCSSEITELSCGQFDNQKDLQSRPCCLCLII